MKRIFIFTSIIFIAFTGVLSAQDTLVKEQPKIIVGKWTDALKVSLIPNPEHVAVYMLVDENFKYTADELIPGIKSYFDHYELPIIFVKQAKPENGKRCSIRIYVGGDCISGDLSNGNFSLLILEYDYKEIFQRIATAYLKANDKS